MTITSQKRILLILIPALILMGLYTWVFHNAFTVRVPGAVDFYPRYAAARFIVEDGINPYSAEATTIIQHEIGADDIVEDSEHYALVYPLYVIFVTAPFLLLPTYAWVQAVWQVMLQVMLLATAVLIIRYYDWKPSAWMLALVLFFSLLSYPSARSIILGQFSVFVFFFNILAFWFLFHGEPTAGRDIVAGVCLALSTVKPQMQFLIIPLLVLWGLRSKRWYFLGSAALSMMVLCGTSFIILPSWFMDWFAQVTGYSSYAPPSIPYILSYEYTSLGRVGMVLAYALPLGYMLFEWWRWLRTNDPRRRDWALALTLVVTHLIAPSTATTHYIVFLFMLIPLFQAWQARSPWLPVAAMAAMFAGYWMLFVVSMDGKDDASIMLLVMPVIILALLLPAASRRVFGRISDKSGPKLNAKAQS